MRYWKFLALPALFAALLSIPSSPAPQVSINIGAEPGCPYGYYDYKPYRCAPYGYYGPEWFSAGVHGYKGPHPERGDNAFNHFHGNEVRDGRGHTSGGHGGGGHR